MVFQCSTCVSSFNFLIHFLGNFQVSPHEFLQAVMKVSKKRFRIGQQSDPVEFMAWLLNTLHANLRTSKKNNSIIYECFQVLATVPILSNLLYSLLVNIIYLSGAYLNLTWQGELEVIKESPNKAITEKKQNADDQNSDQRITDGGTKHDIFTETSRMQFLMLGLDLPPPPLFKDVMEKNIIPQVIMHYVLASLKILIT